MGQKFDERLPSMTDEELYSVDPQTLNIRSRLKLAREKDKRERERAEDERKTAESVPKPEPATIHARWKMGQIIFVVTTLAAAALGAVLVITFS